MRNKQSIPELGGKLNDSYLDIASSLSVSASTGNATLFFVNQEFPYVLAFDMRHHSALHVCENDDDRLLRNYWITTGIPAIQKQLEDYEYDDDSNSLTREYINKAHQVIIKQMTKCKYALNKHKC